MKKLIPPFAALATTLLIILVLFATGIMELNDPVEIKKIDLKGIATQITASQPTSSLTFQDRMKKGDEYVKKNMISLAFNEYIGANQIESENPEPYIKIGKLLFEKQDYTRALEIFQQLLARDPANLDANIYVVRVFMMLRKHEKAREVLGTVPGESQQKKYYEGLLATYFGEYEKAKSALSMTVTMNTDGSISEKAKKILAAFEEFTINQGSQEIFLKTLLAKSLNQVGEYTTSISLLYNVVKEKKDYRDAWILLGYAYLNIHDSKNAIDALEEAKKLDSNKPETIFFLGLAYHENNQKELAAQLIEQAIQKGFEPKIQAKQKLAEIYLEMKAYENAAKNYESVIALNDSDVNYYIRPMWIYIDQLNKPASALRLAEKAVQKNPDSAMAQNLLGWGYIATEEYIKARDALAKSLEKDPTLSAAYLNLGKLYERLSQKDTAKEYYRTAFKFGEGTSVGDAAANSYNKLTGTSLLAPEENPLKFINQSTQANTLQQVPQEQTSQEQQEYKNYTPTVTPDSPSQNLPTFTLPPLTTAP